MRNRMLPITLMLMALIALLLLAGCGNEKTSTGNEGALQTADGPVLAAEPIGIHHAEIEIKDYGTVELELDGNTAPVTVQNFMNLANEGFYDGLTFHRIIDGFMIQGGDPNGNGTGGSEKTITGEFAANGYTNELSHTMGIISMARQSNDMNSASSQFFIMVADAPHLDGQYAAFGHVTAGQNIVAKIAADAEPLDDNGTIAPDRQPVITAVRVID